MSVVVPECLTDLLLWHSHAILIPPPEVDQKKQPSLCSVLVLFQSPAIPAAPYASASAFCSDAPQVMMVGGFDGFSPLHLYHILFTKAAVAVDRG